MNFVEPIRDRKKIAQIKNQLRGGYRYRDLLLFVLGINTALRNSYLFALRVEHFLDDHQHDQRRFWFKAGERGKRQEVVFNARFCASWLARLNKTWLAASGGRLGPLTVFPDGSTPSSKV